MMFPRYLLSFGVLVLFAVIVSANVEVEEPELVDEVEPRNPLLAAAVVIIRQAIKWAAKHCAEEAAHHCKEHWRNPKALVHCARGFLESNKGRCVVG